MEEKITLDLLTKNKTTIDVDFILNYSKNNLRFSEYKFLENIYNHGNEIQPYDLENNFNLKNIQGNWQLPFNENNKNNELLISFFKFLNRHNKKKYKQFIDELYEIYVDLNPILKQLGIIKEKQHKIDIMVGITSTFNYDDIREFYEYSLNYNYVVSTRCKNKTYNDLYNNVQDKLDILLRYVPSKKTLKNIINQL